MPDLNLEQILPDQMETALERLQPSERVQNGFSVGAIHVAIFGQSAMDVALVKPLEPFRRECGCCDIGINVEWLPSISRPGGEAVFDSGTTWRLHEADGEFAFDFHSPGRSSDPFKRLIIDRNFRSAALQMNGAYFASLDSVPEPLGYPLDELLIMHRLTQEQAIELHGAGIVRANGEANLFIGHSGAGKSTTTRLWTAMEDVEVLSDDRIIVRRDGNISAVQTPRMATGNHGEHGVLRLRDRLASPIGHSAQDDRQRMRMYGTPWHGEAVYASPNSAPLTRIFVLEHGHGNVITPLNPSQAVAELFARSFVPFHQHEYVDSALGFLEELANAVPVYRYAFEPDKRAVEKIRNFHD